MKIKNMPISKFWNEIDKLSNKLEISKLPTMKKQIYDVLKKSESINFVRGEVYISPLTYNSIVEEISKLHIVPSIDNVTVQNLDAVLRICDIEINPTILDRIIDVIELLETNGNDVSLKDIYLLQEEWKK